MAENNSKVLFRFGSRAGYDALETKEDNSLYFLLDTNELYRGTVPIGVLHYYEGQARPNEDLEDAIDRILGIAIPVVNDLLIVTETSGVEDLFIYTGDNTWKQLNATIHSESVIFSDGKTLDEKMAETQSNININEKVLELDDDVLSIKDYGKQYYHYVEATEAIGEEGDPDYQPAVAAHYELVTVDQNHPWPSNLTPRTNSAGSLSWYEPNLVTVEGLRDLITEIQIINDTQTRNIETLTQQFSAVEEIQTIVGTLGDQNTPSTGLIKRIEDVETRLTNAGTISGISLNNQVLSVNNNGIVNIGINLNSQPLQVNNGIVNIPVFGQNAGAVPGLVTIVGDIEAMNKNHLLLSANGWVDPIGDLVLNNNAYPTVQEYVDARIEDSTIRWEEIDR